MKRAYGKSGITIIALIITIIVILILAGISIDAGSELIKRAKIESLITNMITIKANAKVYAEEINAEVWDLKEEDEDITKTKSYKRSNLFEEKYQMEKNTTDVTSKVDSSIINPEKCEAYNITKETLHAMGLSDLANNTNDGDFVVIYDSDDFTKLEIVYPSGIKYDKETYWTLSSIKSKMEE